MGAREDAQETHIGLLGTEGLDWADADALVPATYRQRHETDVAAFLSDPSGGRGGKLLRPPAWAALGSIEAI